MPRTPEKAELLREIKSSGQTVSEFSRERAIPATTLNSLMRRERKVEGCFVRVGAPARTVKIVISENIRLEVPVEQLRDVITALGVTL